MFHKESFIQQDGRIELFNMIKHSKHSFFIDFACLYAFLISSNKIFMSIKG